MSLHVDVRALARSDLLHYFEYILADSPEAAFRFIDAAEATFEQLATWPKIGRPRSRPGLEHLDIRSIPVEGFPNHLIFYRLPDEHAVRILRVRHSAMDFDAISFDDE